MTYTVENASSWPLDRLGPFLSDIVAQMGRLAKRFPKDVTTAGLFQEFLAGKKTLWLVLDKGTFAAIAMTTIRTIDGTGTRIFTLCDLAGRDVRRFDDALCQTLEQAAADNNCDEIAIEGRDGWRLFAKKHGYKTQAVLFRKTR